MSSLYFTMNATIDANLKERAIENIMAAKKPEMVLFIWSWLKVLGSGLLTGVIVIVLGPK